MSLESATYIADLVATNPAAGDVGSQGDDHLRLIKDVLQNTFPSLTGAVTLTHTEINELLTRVTTLESNSLTKSGSKVWTGNQDAGTKKVTNMGNPSNAQDAATKAYVDAAITAAVNSKSDEIVVYLRNTFFPIGTWYFNETDPRNPAEILQFGSWVQTCQVRMPLGCGTTTDARGEFRAAGQGGSGGNFQELLDVTMIPPHSHDLKIVSRAIDGDSSEGDKTVQTTGTSAGNYVEQTGGGQPHNNLPPYQTVAIWRRVA